MNATRVRMLMAAVAVAALAAGCGGSDEDAGDEPTTTAAPTTEAPAEEPEEEPAEIELLEGETVLADGFDDDGNGWVGSFDDTGQPVTADLADGVLTFAAAEEGGLDLWPDAISDDAMDHTDQRVTATVVLTKGGSAAVSCRLDPEGQYPRQYSFALSSAGVYNIGKYDGASWDRTTLAVAPEELAEQSADDVPIDEIEYEPVFEFDEATEYEITGQCVDLDEGVQLAMFVDGELVLSTVDEEDPIEAGVGAVGVEASFLANGGTFVPYGAAWDDFEFVAAAGDGSDDDQPEPGSGSDEAAIQGDGSEYCLQEGDLPEGFLPLAGRDNLTNALDYVFAGTPVEETAREHLEASWMVLPEGGAGETDVTADCTIHLFDTPAAAEEVAEWYIGTFTERGDPPATEIEPSDEAPGDDPHVYTNEIGGRPSADVAFVYENVIVSVGATGTSSNDIETVSAATEQLASIVYGRLEAAG